MIAVDNATIAQYAKVICRPYPQIEVMQSNIHSVDVKADAIVCEWMGYFLLYEGFVYDVIKARNKMLMPGGVIIPD